MTIDKSSPVICVYIAIVAVTSQSDNKMRCICTGMKRPSLAAEGELATSCFCKYELTHNAVVVASYEWQWLLLLLLSHRTAAAVVTDLLQIYISIDVINCPLVILERSLITASSLLYITDR